jgi:hypothetical protein
VKAFDTDGEAVAIIGFDFDLSLAHDGVSELRDLLALWQVGIEIVLAVET